MTKYDGSYEATLALMKERGIKDMLWTMLENCTPNQLRAWLEETIADGPDSIIAALDAQEVSHEPSGSESVLIAPPEPVGPDPEIRDAVLILRRGGIETYESCQGGSGHSYGEPTISFYGTMAAGWHAVGVAKDAGLPIKSLERTWDFDDGEPSGPYWRIVLRQKVDGLIPSGPEKILVSMAEIADAISKISLAPRQRRMAEAVIDAIEAQGPIPTEERTAWLAYGHDLIEAIDTGGDVGGLLEEGYQHVLLTRRMLRPLSGNTTILRSAQDIRDRLKR